LMGHLAAVFGRMRIAMGHLRRTRRQEEESSQPAGDLP
jgi:hypothetical protein